ncbi:hypothetical protein MVES1_002135 [Malassezia vespertilionis]|uniref:Uncharacterized protein n=1 Tax=Malassezia vespertilionis TaxID=2020962 RepID=A0A2N1JC71_9BASI|nr:uncharacterized protein MVES1_002135 [Malassezia vespertilionis]PKI84160.1 hypothetical protein MVES_002014 [Malassezia vespertilionis]WFD06781.1 hypothetical protein MVES1_002135 [Malassezia vespertilionis]
MTSEESKASGLYVCQDEAVAAAAPYVSSGYVSRRPSTWRDWFAVGPLDFRQYFYLIAMHGFGCMVLSGAANFGVACAMYRTDNGHKITVWAFKDNTIAGDMGVTIIIQQLITTIISTAMTHFDLRHGMKPLRRPWPPMMHFPSNPTPNGSWLGTKMPSVVREKGLAPLYMGNAEGKSRFVAIILWFLRATSTGSERNVFYQRGITFRQRIERLAWTALQGLWLAVLSFWWYWPIAIAIVAPIFEHKDMRGSWAPPLIKLIFGGVLGLLTNPYIALASLGAESSVRRVYPNAPGLPGEEQEEDVTTQLFSSTPTEPHVLQEVKTGQ